MLVILFEGVLLLFIVYGESYIEFGYKVMDNVDGDIIECVEVIGEVGSEIGDYMFKYNVIDEVGNDVEEVFWMIIIVDFVVFVFFIF